MAGYYASVFPETEIVDQNQWVHVLKMHGQRIMLLNGGDMFRTNPSFSLMYLTTREKEVETIYTKLVEGGRELMPLDSYPFSSKYSWIEDRFGVSWQLYTAGRKLLFRRLFLRYVRGCAE